MWSPVFVHLSASRIADTMGADATELGKVMLSGKYKSLYFTDTNSVICKIRRQIYMKATGIVRRVEEYGIIGQTSKKSHKH